MGDGEVGEEGRCPGNDGNEWDVHSRSKGQKVNLVFAWKHLALEPRLDVLSQVVNSILEVLRNTATFITCLSGQVWSECQRKGKGTPRDSYLIQLASQFVVLVIELCTRIPVHILALCLYYVRFPHNASKGRFESDPQAFALIYAYACVKPDFASK